ncbi:hypothetical protein ARMGADRAFT_1032152 [Armillaria gallica]|uniref:Uncharacterized protein n=1 Tax=Armillaria gallica TaxID=47427 RepID=A0A2H3DAG5_ARMGA|nr:hypothetical protein ARMGADRAFT_1032152 [Armillaria gallica]
MPVWCAPRPHRELKESHLLHLALLVTRMERIEKGLESIEENNKDIEDALMGSINEAIRESLDEWLGFKAVARMAAMNRNTTVYPSLRIKGSGTQRSIENEACRKISLVYLLVEVFSSANALALSVTSGTIVIPKYHWRNYESLYSQAGTDWCITGITVGYPPVRCLASCPRRTILPSLITITRLSLGFGP